MFLRKTTRANPLPHECTTTTCMKGPYIHFIHWEIMLHAFVLTLKHNTLLQLHQSRVLLYFFTYHIIAELYRKRYLGGITIISQQAVHRPFQYEIEVWGKSYRVHRRHDKELYRRLD